MMSKRIAIALTLSAVIFVSHATAQTWSGAVNGNWATAGNWSSLPVNNGNASLIFGATSNSTMNQNLGSPFSVDGMTFNAGAPAYTISGGPIAIQDNPNFTQGIIVQNSSLPVTFATPLQLISNEVFFQGAGSGVVTVTGVVTGAIYKQSTGTLVLTNSGNSVYDADVAAGTLKITSPTAVNNVQVDSGGVFQIGFTSGTNGGAAAGNITLYNGAMTVPSGSADYYVNTMTGTGTVDFTGSSNFWLHFTNGVTGPLISIGTDARNPLAGSFNWIGSGGSRIQNDAMVPLNVQVASSDTLTCGIILANGATSQPIYVTGGGALILINTGNTANFAVDYGTKIQVANLACLGTGTLTLEGTSAAIGSFPGGAIIYTGPSATLSKNITLAYSNGGSLVGGGGSIGATQNGAILTVSSIISEAYPSKTLSILGNGTSSSNAIVTLTGVNTYTGATAVYGGGILAISTIPNGGTAGPIGAASNSPVNLYLGVDGSGGGTLFYTGASTSTDRGITFSSLAADAGYVQVTTGATLTLNGQMTGGTLNKNGLGTLILSNGTNFFRNANVWAGTLAISNPLALGPNYGTVNVMSGGVLQLAYGLGGNQNAPVALLNLNGGAFAVPAGLATFCANVISTQAGGVIDMSGSQAAAIQLVGSMPAINVQANATWIGAGLSGIENDTSAPAPITISPGVTLTNGIILNVGAQAQGFQVTGGGTLYETGGVGAPLTVTNATLQIANASLFTQSFALALDGGTFKYTGNGASDTLTRPVTITANGGTVFVTSASTTLQLTGNLTGAGLFAKEGPGTLALTNAGSFTGAMLVDTGVLQLQGPLGGTAAVTVNGAGNLQYATSQSTGRTFNLNYGTFSATSGTTATLNAATVNGGFLRGPGTFALTGGAALNGVTIQSSAVVSQTGLATFTNVSQGGQLSVGPTLASTMIGLTNQGSGSITVGQDGQLSVQDFQSYGVLTLNPGSYNGTSGNVTQLTNTGSSPLYFNGGSRTFISTVAQAQNQNAGIDLHGNDAIVAGALLVNNGYVYDSTGNNHRIVADFGAVVKGAGFYQPLPKTINGGTFITGNSPGHATTGTIVLGGPNDPNGGLSDYTWQINDAGPSTSHPSATGVSGPSANAARLVSGWGTLLAVAGTSPIATTGGFRWDATPADKLTIHLQTLLAPDDAAGNSSVSGGFGASGDMTPGLMTDFDPSQSYSWRMFAYQGGYSGPIDSSALDASTDIDTIGFLNPHAGRFDLLLNQSAQELDLVYTPTAVPEPGTLSLIGLAALGFAGRYRRGQHRAGR
jgi:autotransporter-associated beta strand protein